MVEPSSPPNFVSPIFVALIGIMSAAIVLTIYHCIVMTWCNPHRRSLQASGAFPSGGDTTAISMEVSTAQLIPPAQTYGKGEGKVSGGESACPVCLCDFRDGEDVRVLPECMHYFHVPCIDMWLQSHNSCPMCRTETGTPASRLLPLPLPPPPPQSQQVTWAV